MLHGTAASDGIGIGRVMLVEEHSLEYTHKTTEDTEAELQRFKNAVSIFCDNTAAQADTLRKSAGDKEAEILEGHIQIIKDPYLSGEIEKLIANGQCAEAALEHMCDMFISMFSSADDELTNQRAADVKDIKTGILSILLGINEVKICAAPKGTVIVAKELTPSMTAGINKENIVGIITETGGKTSHSAILARALEIPAVLSVNGATTKLSAGEMVITDGCEGIVIASPDENLIQAYTTKQNAVLKQHFVLLYMLVSDFHQVMRLQFPHSRLLLPFHLPRVLLSLRLHLAQREFQVPLQELPSERFFRLFRLLYLQYFLYLYLPSLTE